MKPEVKELIEKAKRSQKSAELMFREKEFDFAGSRAYYTFKSASSVPPTPAGFR